MTQDLGGQVALVTGAARGIGAAIAARFALAGARVYATDVRKPVVGRGEASDGGATTRFVQADITDRDRIKRMVDEIVAEAGTLDVLVNNAGVIHRGGFLSEAPEAFDEVMAVNLGGALNCLRAVLPFMVARRRGAVVTVSSVAGKVGDITAAPSYGTSKGALNTLTKSLAREFGPHGVRVNAVAPHAIETDMSAEWTARKRAQVTAAIPLGRMGTPGEVAEAVLFLACTRAGFVTGEVLDVNGGYLMD